MTTRNKIISLFYIIFAFIILLGCNDSKVLKDIETGFVPSASGASIFHVLESSCLSDYKIKTRKYKSSDLLALDLVRNQVQVALVCGMAEILSQIEKHPDKIIVIGIFESVPCFLIPPGSSKNYISLLNSGKKTMIGCWPGATFPRYTRIVLDSLKLNSNNIYITPIAPNLQINQLEKEEIDALVTLEPIGVQAVVDGKAEYLYDDINLLAKFVIQGNYFPGGCLAISKQFYLENPKFVNDLISCLKKEGQSITSNNPITIQALTKYTSLLTHYTPRMLLKPIIMGEELIGHEMETLVKSLISMNKLDSSINWKDSFYMGK